MYLKSSKVRKYPYTDFARILPSFMMIIYSNILGTDEPSSLIEAKMPQFQVQPESSLSMYFL